MPREGCSYGSHRGTEGTENDSKTLCALVFREGLNDPHCFVSWGKRDDEKKRETGRLMRPIFSVVASLWFKKGDAYTMILDQFYLTDKVAIVTGVATGLGKAMAIGLAEAGADIVGVYNTHAPEEVQAQIEAQGRKFLGIQADLLSIEPIPHIVEQAVTTFGNVNILVNNAGTIRRAPALEFTEQDWDEVMNVNLKAAFFLCQAVARQFLKQGTGGKIINIASLLAFQGGILIPSYTSSKSGLRGLTQLLANEWARHNININAIAPGYMETDNTAPLRNDPVRNNAILERIPAGHWGKPEDLQGAVVFLASEASEYMNGFTLAVDGGWLGR